MKLVIAEKPSVAMSIAKVLGASARKEGHMEGGGWLVSWCVGHLAGLAEPAVYDLKFDKWRREDLPILPENWRFTVGRDKRERFDILQTLLRREDVSEVVNACDAGREGELIFRTAYHLAGCTKPMKRLWISSMEDSAIREGFANLRPGREYDGLHQAALCRQKADWLVGINATRLFTVLYPQPDLGGAAGPGPGQVREDAPDVPEGLPSGNVQPSDAERDAVQPPAGDRGSGQQPVGADDAGAGESGGGNGGAESQRPDEVGGADEQLQGPGGGNYSVGADLQLSFMPPEIPSQQEQIQAIQEAESADAPSAFTVPQAAEPEREPEVPAPASEPVPLAVTQADIDEQLRFEAPLNLQNLRIYELFQQDLSIEARVEAVGKVFGRSHVGHPLPNGMYRWTDYFPDAGIVIRKTVAGKESEKITVSWADAEKRLRQLIEEGRYLAPEEMEQYRQTHPDQVNMEAAQMPETERPVHVSLGAVLALNYTIEFPQKIASLTLIAPQYKTPWLLLRFQMALFQIIPGSAFQEIGLSKKDMILLQKSMLKLDFTSMLNRITCPALIICGQNDKANRKAAMQLVKYLPNAKIKTIENAGHEVNVDMPEKLAEVIAIHQSRKC